MAFQTYTVPNEYNGKTLTDIYNQWGGGFNQDVVGAATGLGRTNPLQAGQQIRVNLPDNYQNSSESQAISKLFGNPLSQDQLNAQAADSATQSALKQASALRDFNIQSAQPQIAALQQGKTDLQTQYNSVLESIRGNQTAAGNQATVNTKNELARRGVVGGGYYDNQLQQGQQQAIQPYNSVLAQTNAGEAQDIAGLNSQIGALQSGNPSGAISSALNIGQMSQQAQQFAVNEYLQQQQTAADNEFRNRQLSQQMDIAQMQNQPQPINPYVNLSPGATLLNTQTGSSYTAPKSYAASSPSQPRLQVVNDALGNPAYTFDPSTGQMQPLNMPSNNQQSQPVQPAQQSSGNWWDTISNNFANFGNSILKGY